MELNIMELNSPNRTCRGQGTIAGVSYLGYTRAHAMPVQATGNRQPADEWALWRM